MHLFLNSCSISSQCLFPPIFVCLSHSKTVPHRYDLLNQSIRKRRYFTALAVLEKQELIFRKRQGPGQPNRIYVKLPKETIHYTDRFLSLRQTENCPIDRQDSFPDTDRKLSGNKKEIKKNNLEKRGSKEPLSPYGKFQNVFLSEKELEDIRQTIPDWKDYIERLSGYMASTGKQYQNHAATIISWARQDHPASRQRNYESEEYETL